MFSRELTSEEQTEVLAKQLSELIKPGCVVYLKGDLGAGKTTFTRHFLRSLGYVGKVKSPTFTLVEPYEFDSGNVFHFDLYRIESSDELKQLGLDEYFNNDSICLIEWPDKGEPILPSADLICKIEIKHDNRNFSIEAATDKGKSILQQLEAN